MKNRLYKLGAIVMVVALGVVAFWPVDHWRLYDDLWRPLALTHAENYCSGQAVAQQAYSADAKTTPGCEEASGWDNVTPSISNSVAWACEGVHAADSSFPIADCIAIINGYQLWFLLGGGYTGYWSDARPRPEEVVVAPEEGRGENRGDFSQASTNTTTSESEEDEDDN